MRKLLKIATALSMIIAAQSASAISLRFKFKTNSSGPNIYACNAGIMTPTHVKVCYVQGSKTQCDPGQCAPNDSTCIANCICTSTGGGDSLMNYAFTEYNTWRDNSESAGTPTPSTITSAGAQSEFNTFFADTAAWDKSLASLNFNLGSELYNAQYFVDVCFRGPQIEYFKDGVKTNWAALAQISASDFNEGGSEISYSKLAALKVKSYMVCDTQGAGTYKYAHNGSNWNNGTYDSSTNEAIFTGTKGSPTGGGDIPMVSSGEFSLPLETSVKNLINTILTFTPGSIRFCKVRYIFEETDSAKAQTGSDGPNLRKWQRHGAEICTYTEFNEVPDEAPAQVLKLIKM